MPRYYLIVSRCHHPLWLYGHFHHSGSIFPHHTAFTCPLFYSAITSPASWQNKATAGEGERERETSRSEGTKCFTAWNLKRGASPVLTSFVCLFVLWRGKQVPRWAWIKRKTNVTCQMKPRTCSFSLLFKDGVGEYCCAAAIGKDSKEKTSWKATLCAFERNDALKGLQSGNVSLRLVCLERNIHQFYSSDLVW